MMIWYANWFTIGRTRVRAGVFNVHYFPFREAIFRSTDSTSYPYIIAITFRMSLVRFVMYAGRHGRIVVSRDVFVARASPASAGFRVIRYGIFQRRFFLASSPTWYR